MIPSATPVAAPVIKPRMVRLVMEGVLPTNRKPATAIHKVQRTMRIFIGVLPTAASLPLSPLAAGVQQKDVSFQSGKDSITVPFPWLSQIVCDHGSKSYRARKIGI
jgi:hypothetical protein